MRTQQQTFIMYGFIGACILTIVSLVLPAYYLEYHGGMMGDETEAMRLIQSYITWPIAICAVLGIAAILFKYSKRNVLITGGIQVAGLLYEVIKVTRVQDSLKDGNTTLGSLSEMYAMIGGGTGIEARLGIGFVFLIIAAAAVAFATALCFFLVDDNEY